MKRKLHYAWFILAGVILVRGFAGGGINMTSGLFLAPVSQTLGVGVGSLSIYLSVTSVVLVLWLPIAGRLINRYDVRLVASLGIVLQAAAFMGFGLMKGLMGWYLLAIPYAMGAAIVVNLLGPILINRWFSKNTGLMLGIQMAFVGLFGAGLQPLASRIIAQNGWRHAYFLIGGACFIVVLAAILILLRNQPADRGLSPCGAGARPDPAAQARSADIVEIPEKTATRSASFFLLLLFMIALTGVGVFTQHIPTYGGVLGYSLEQTGAALAFASFGNAVGSIAIGLVSDRIGSLKTCYAVIAVGILAAAGFFFSGGGIALFLLSTFLHGLVSSGVMVLAPILTIRFYGQRDYEKIYAKVSMGAPLASILLVPAYGFVYDHTGSYLPVLAAMLLLLLLASLCIAFGWRKRCTAAGCPGWKK